MGKVDLRSMLDGQPNGVARVLGEIGVESYDLGGYRIARRGAIDGGYIHHSKIPVAAVAFALTDPEGCRERFPKLTLIDLVKMVGSMDLFEHHTLSILCGNDRRERIVPDASRFGQRVWKAIDAYELGHLFERVARFDGKPEDSHYRMRPRGFDWSGSWSPLPAVLDQWRKDYRKLEVGRQMMAMSVLHLYNETPDKSWTNRVPRSWHVGEGVRLLKSEGALADWGALMGLYSGW